MYPSISIVINTLNRGPVLQKTLESFRWLRYPGEFEVIVVNGPSTDNTDEVIASWLPKIRAGKCEFANLSISRNVGICMARGDIVAFIDDDAIPEPEWLTQLAEPYRDPIVGAVGGFVYNHTGYDFQYKYGVVDRYAHAYLDMTEATPHLSFPKSRRFPHLLGCNSSFRRSALLEIGGFDEEFEYFLDETDVCLRIVDAGYLIAQLPCAYVHHKYAPSNIRGENKVVRNRYPVIKNKIYFSLKHAREFFPTDRVMDELSKFIEKERREVIWAEGEGLLTCADVTKFEEDVVRAYDRGVQRGFEGVKPDALIDAKKLERYAGDFLPFETFNNGRTIVLTSRDFPPNHGGGIATFTKDLAEALAARGSMVHVITQSQDTNRVDFENGVWVHRIVPREIERTPAAIERNIPPHIWNWSATALAETRRIAEHRDIDVVESPIWDCEGIAFLLDGKWPLVTSLHTTLHFWLESHPEHRHDVEWMASFGTPMLALENELMTKADAVRANSHAIVREIEQMYGLTFDVAKMRVVPHGMAEPSVIQPNEKRTAGVEVLFVGRLEPRKGIDVLLEAIPTVLDAVPDVRFRIVGDDSFKLVDGRTYKDAFLNGHENSRWRDRVRFDGRVGDSALHEAYATCDVFVAPSRFESFGLVFLEAMRVGKPVIGCAAGGMPEVVEHGVNGLLVPPGDAAALAQAILRLVRDSAERAAMGARGRQIFETRFTADQMADKSVELYELARTRAAAHDL
ncbi:glycosyltransferase [Burkholderia multivorans]|uniref:glycosyltransferase n=1 Tax=Burkholderia multivorans TaxID=87883 RepID=UPI001906F300|nr:glycosyltransferase [Burkholderia multivorans]MBJ9621099.1 glycosyltransferase [Burkholderia multivorans]